MTTLLGRRFPCDAHQVANQKHGSNWAMPERSRSHCVRRSIKTHAGPQARSTHRCAPGPAVDVSMNESPSSIFQAAFRFPAARRRFTGFFARFVLPLRLGSPGDRLAEPVGVRLQPFACRSSVGLLQQLLTTARSTRESILRDLAPEHFFYLDSFSFDEFTRPSRPCPVPAGSLLIRLARRPSRCPDHFSANPGLLFHGTALLQLDADSHPLLAHGTQTCYPESLIHSELVLQDSLSTCEIRGKQSSHNEGKLVSLSYAYC